MKKNIESFGFLDLVNILKKRVKFIVSFYLIALACSSLIILIFNKYYTPYYEINFTVKSEILTPKQTAPIIEDIILLKENENIERFCNVLNIDKKDAENIIAIEIPPFVREEEEILKINISLSDTSTIPIIMKAIVNYLNDQPYVKNNIAKEKSYIQSYIKDLELEIKELEEIKEIFYNQIKNKKIVQTNIISPTQANIHLMELKEQRFNIFKEFQGLNGFQVVKPPLIPGQPKKLDNFRIFILTNILIIITAIILAVYQKKLLN